MVMIYMGMNRILFVMWMAGMLLLSSCSVKEDRSGCPCWMTVEMPEQVGHDGGQVDNDDCVVLRLRGNSDEDEVGYSYQVTEAVKPDVGALEYEVPRGSVGVSAVALGNEIPGQAGYDGIAGYDGDKIRIPVGEQMDSLYGFFRRFYTKCESVLCDVELHKEFCTVSFTLGDDGYISPYDLEIWGNVAGVSAWDLMPLEGDFRFAPSPEDGVYRVRVPRQSDASLELVMLEDSEIVDRLPLGEYITRSGYDWAGEDLADVHIALDMEKQQVMITVIGWDGVVVMDIVI